MEEATPVRPFNGSAGTNMSGFISENDDVRDLSDASTDLSSDLSSLSGHFDKKCKVFVNPNKRDRSL
jgi:hypothetical protein